MFDKFPHIGEGNSGIFPVNISSRRFLPISKLCDDPKESYTPYTNFSKSKNRAIQWTLLTYIT
jgi:hypothetical protein